MPGRRTRRPWRPLALAAVASLLAGSLLAAPGRTADAEGRRNVLQEAGRNLYVQHCAACHGPYGRGDGAVAAVLTTKPTDLTTIAERRRGFRDGEIAAYIDGRTSVAAHGTREMPVWGERLSADMPLETGDEVARGQISLIVEYLKTIQRPPQRVKQ